MRERNLGGSFRERRMLLTILGVVGIGSLCFGALLLLSQSPETAVEVIQTLTPTVQSVLESLTATAAPTTQATIEAVQGAGNWDCVTISQSNPNMIRAVLAAGEPGVLESGPYQVVHNAGDSEIWQKLRDLVHFRDVICVRAGN